jgi:hypothetical protein
MPLEHLQKYGYLTLRINKLELPHAHRYWLFLQPLRKQPRILEALRAHLQ